MVCWHYHEVRKVKNLDKSITEWCNGCRLISGEPTYACLNCLIVTLKRCGDIGKPETFAERLSEPPRDESKPSAGGASESMKDGVEK